MSNNLESKKKSSFSGTIGFVLASAGSAVGLGNIWRFPYLAAQGGGGVFLVTYIVLALTFGFTLLTTEVAIGRKTRRSPIEAYEMISKKWKFLGYLSFIIPALIITYYTVIGGWVVKYLVTYLCFKGNAAADSSFFTSFISSPVSSIIFMLIFFALTAFIVYNGVEEGIEKSSKWIMPGLFILIMIIAIYSLFLKFDDNGTVRTGWQGFLHYIIPSFKGMTVTGYLEILLSAMGQLFYSLSVAMGIMITYGSYVKKDVNLPKSLGQIEFFDTLIAFLAGMMIIPAVYVFFGMDGMSAGPSLIFVSLPKVFQSMGFMGQIVGIIFFVMVLFAALTSCVSILETLVANCIEVAKISRKKACLTVTSIAMILAAIICLGYSVFYFEVKLPNGSVGQLLDIADYLSNSFLMPIVAILTCILIGWVVKPQWIIDEIEADGVKFKRKKLYIIMVKYIAPILLFILLLQSVGFFSLIEKLFS